MFLSSYFVIVFKYSWKFHWNIMKIVSFFCLRSRTTLLPLQFLSQKIYSYDITVISNQAWSSFYGIIKSTLTSLFISVFLFNFVNVLSRTHGMADDSFSCCISYSTLHHGYICFMFFGISNSLLNYFVSRVRNRRLSFHHPKQKHSFSVCSIVFKLIFSH